jgi:hypothetical protein
MLFLVEKLCIYQKKHAAILYAIKSLLPGMQDKLTAAGSVSRIGRIIITDYELRITNIISK